MRVLVLGAGVIGVTSAWYLNQAGHEVTVLERHPEPARETSFANGGQISVSHAEPWANPGAPWQVLKWLGRSDAPLLFRPRADIKQWEWAIRFLLECAPGRARANARRILALALRSAAELKRLRAETGVSYDALTRGILSFYTSRREFEHASALAADLGAFGCVREVKTVGQCLAIEPALEDAAPRLAGGIFAPGDESGDARLFTHQLAALSAQRGVQFRFSETAERIAVEADKVAGVVVNASGRGHFLAADAYVVALGVYGVPLLEAIGISTPVYPVKGYSVTLPIVEPAAAPTVSLTDDERKLVFSRLGGRLRVAGTAELAGYDQEINAARCGAILARVFELFPRVGDPAQAQFWAGLRPSTPGNVPLIGATRYPNLFLNTGHGTLGWTLACGSGFSVAEIVSGRRPDVNFSFL